MPTRMEHMAAPTTSDAQAAAELKAPTDADACVTPLPLALPVDLQLGLLSLLAMRDRLALRATCSAMRMLGSLPEIWAELAPSMWAAAQPFGSGRDDCGLNCAGPASLVPTCIQAATLVDACARMVPWPAALTRKALLGTSSREAAFLGAAITLDHSSIDYAKGTNAAHVRVSGGDLLADFRLSWWQLGITMADTAFPHMFSPLASGEKGGPLLPRGPLPFATPATALGTPRGWALRLTAYWEVTLASAPPSVNGPGGAIYIGLLNGETTDVIDRFARVPNPATTIADGVAAAVRGEVEGGIFMRQVAPWRQEALEASDEAQLTWFVDGKRQSKTVLRKEKKGSPLALRQGDTIGVGIDYLAGVAFFTHNGVRLDETEVPIALGTKWRPTVAVNGSAAVRANFGVPTPSATAIGAPEALEATEPFRFDVLGYEAALWQELHGRHALKELKKRSVPLSRSFRAAFRSSLVERGTEAWTGGASKGRVFVGTWGAHVPNNFVRQPVASGSHEVVLALSGKPDNYCGWGRALHKEAKVPNERVDVRPGQTTLVELRLTIGPPTSVVRVKARGSRASPFFLRPNDTYRVQHHS